MNLQRLGSDYGGWTIDLDAVPDDSVIIDAGIGGDDSFSRELLKLKRVTVLAIDPSEETKALYKRTPAPPGLVFIPRAVTRGGIHAWMSKGDKRSDAMMSCGMPGMTQDCYLARAISIRELVENNNVSLVKLDIEGAEFEGVLEQCIGVPQVAVEFHTKHMPNRMPERDALVQKFMDAGYAIIHRTEHDEITFLRS